LSAPPLPPVRVEKALGLLPELEALAPLRALLVSISSPDKRAQWSSSGPYLTLGKRGLDPDEVRRRLPVILHQMTEHLQAVYTAYVEALECQQRDDGGGTVAALVQAGRLEETVGRLAPARAWYEVALGVSEALQNRRPEVESLRSLGRLSLALGRDTEGARYFQRALALAEAEADQTGAIAACRGLGDAALQQGEWVGAQAWYARGLRLAEAAGDTRAIGEVQHALGELARKQGDLTAAGDHLRHALECFEASGDTREMARALNTHGLVEASRGRDAAAVGAYREALAWARRRERDWDIEVSVRINLAHLHLEAGRLLEAEEELRRAEQVAIAASLPTRLVQIYVLLGTLRGRQGDETGFVFFEHAVELACNVARSPLLEAQAYYEYGLFQQGLGHQEEARAYLERAGERVQAAGGGPDVERVREELRHVSA
jgi:tetratricopeptide (TPR) repeat protein